ncbi:MAG: [FeFe] hydrogenase H-cluster maturation GTPase HydF [Bacteroidales bacterium]|nr:[FeFe] hydrogenase H-cluster maturation GTPase HydF [Bacteroidales bacterium]
MKGKDLKPHIGIYGRRNNGKSSLINYLTQQNTSIVSDHPGTTTDPVKKSVEIFGVGPAIIIDTAGIDDENEIGKLRVDKAKKTISTIDMAILVIAGNAFDHYEKEMIQRFNDFAVPFFILHNKSDEHQLTAQLHDYITMYSSAEIIDFSTKDESLRDDLIQIIRNTIPPSAYQQTSLFKGVIRPKDVVLLITPIDSEAPEGRMILPQVMAWRDVLDQDAICISVKETELEDFLKLGIKPVLAVTDSQVFDYVSGVIPEDVPLTSFSIVFARYRGDFEKYLEGTPFIDSLKDGDKILILESCTHQVSCEDIGRHKIPAWLKKHTGKNIEFRVVSGLSDIEGNIDDYQLVIQCGGCVITAKQLKGRLKPFIDNNIPVTNYGLAIAYMNGIFDRVTRPFIQRLR